jgi:palmitoyl-protein thioesterase
MGSCNQQSRLGVLCIAACVSVCILLAVPTVLCFATRVSLVEEEEGARGGGGGGGAAATAIIQEKPLPFIVLHGIGDECKNHGLYQFTQLLINTSGAVGFCIEIGDGAGDSFFMRLDKQADLVCDQVKEIPELQSGYNIVGLSQGNVIGRAVIEFCDSGPPVHNFVSLGGPHAGTASIPGCAAMSLCWVATALIRLGVYSSFVQNHLAPSGYVKIPDDLDAYYKGCLFLPKLNNEIASNWNATYKDRLSSLNHLVLIMFEHDTVLIPRETAWFGYYGEEQNSVVQTPQETRLYKEDWVGLRALDEAGRVSYVSFPGDHLRITKAEVDEYVIPHLRTSKTASLL